MNTDVHIDAFENTGGRLQTRNTTTPRLHIELRPWLELPDANTEAGALARLFLAENAGPQHDLFDGQENARECMKWMVHVLRNRLALGAHHFSATGAKDLIGMIRAKNQVAGFEDYPKIAPDKQKNIEDAVQMANDGTHLLNIRLRTYLQSAIEVATRQDIGIDPSSTGIYAWRTAGRKGPGASFLPFQKLGGQQFYTLTEQFLNAARGQGRRN